MGLAVAQIIASLTDRGAGPSYSVRRLSEALQAHGAAVALHSVAGWRGGSGRPMIETGLAHTAHPQTGARVPGLQALCLSRALHATLLRHRPDVVHTHGLWLMPNVYPADITRRTGSALVLSPRGMLGPAALGFSRLKKAAFWLAWQRTAVRVAKCLHATSAQEHAEIRAFGLTNPVAVIPNGIDLPVPALPAEHPAGARVVLSLGRIHPIKGLERLLRAWARIEPTHPRWRLDIVGPDEDGHAAELWRLAGSLGLGRVSIEGPRFGEAKLAAYRDADLFVLPTLNENFALTVAEALAAGTPVIATKGAPWAGLESERCGWWIEHGVEPLAATLDRALTLPRGELQAMGTRGRAWMARDFSWDRVAGDMLSVYRWVSDRGEMPACVRRD